MSEPSKLAPKKLIFDGTEKEVINLIFKRNPTELFNLPSFRRHYAFRRWRESGRSLETYQQPDERNIATGAIVHNSKELTDDRFSSVQRTGRLLGPLSGLSPVYENAAELKILSIGPRTEMEIFHMLAVGFRPKNIYSIDLITNSEFVLCADMHNIPFESNFFDIVLSSWVINYSVNPRLAMSESVRVLKSGGLLAVGATHDATKPTQINPNIDDPEFIVGCTFANTDDILSLLDESLRIKKLFNQDSNFVGSNKTMLIAQITKD